MPGNMYFTTTKFHQEYAGGTFVDVIVDEAHDPASRRTRSRATSTSTSCRRSSTSTAPTGSRTSRSRPTSTWPAASRSRWPTCGRSTSSADATASCVMLDATRALENAYFIQQREDGYADKSVAEILREICSYTDGATVSSKKDNLVNIGGFLALRDPELAREARALLVAFEGLHTYGGMSGRDMEALARGIREMVATDDHVRARVGQVEYLGKLINEAGVADRAAGRRPRRVHRRRSRAAPPAQDQFPAQALTAAIYVDSGVRAMERGIVSAGRNPETGDHNRPKLELVRLTIPRRVYTQSHMDVVAESVVAVYEDRDEIRGCSSPTSPPSCASSRRGSRRSEGAGRRPGARSGRQAQSGAPRIITRSPRELHRETEISPRRVAGGSVDARRLLVDESPGVWRFLVAPPGIDHDGRRESGHGRLAGRAICA